MALPAASDEAKFAALTTQLKHWISVYPLDIFPEPDMAKAHELLRAGGMALDAVAASNVRHTLQRVLEMCADYD
jgi:hypothetical protein